MAPKRGFCYTLIMQGIEKEFKWNATARGAFKRFEQALQKATGALPQEERLLITDRYLDDATQTFSKQKIALRIRCQNGRFEATLKTKTALQNGLACRQEETRPLAGCLHFPAALKQLQAMPCWQGLPLAHLTVRFIIKNRRKTYLVTYRRAVCEAALDRYTIYAAGRRQTKREIELELKSGSEKDFASLVQLLSVQSALPACTKSKVASAEELLKKQI